MPTQATVQAKQESYIVVQIAFTDEDSAAMTPDSIRWSWMTPAGAIINSRDKTVITAASTIKIVLSGDDLAMQNSASKLERGILVIDAAVTTDEVTSKPLRESYEIDVISVLKKAT